MLIKEIGEFGLIKRLQKSLRTDASVIKGSGDDCAVLAFDKNSYQLFTCDMIVEGVDFSKKDKPELIARKALAISISDIASCGGIPSYALVSMGIPKDTTVEFIDKLAAGLFSLAKEYKINIVGGDLSRSRQLAIDLSLLGRVEKKNLVLREGAKEGDIIFVSGALGGSIYGKHLKFTPRIKEARYLVKNFKVNAMIDISDGLLADLGHILEEGRVGAFIYESLIPVSKEAKSFNHALCDGEDFELLFTLAQNQAVRLLQNNPFGFKPIGRIEAKKNGFNLVDKNWQKRAITAKGYSHF